MRDPASINKGRHPRSTPGFYMLVHALTHICNYIYTYMFIHVLLTVIVYFTLFSLNYLSCRTRHSPFFIGHCFELVRIHIEKEMPQGSHIGCEFYSLPFSSHNPPHICSHGCMKANDTVPSISRPHPSWVLRQDLSLACSSAGRQGWLCR